MCVGLHAMQTYKPYGDTATASSCKICECGRVTYTADDLQALDEHPVRK